MMTGGTPILGNHHMEDSYGNGEFLWGYEDQPSIWEIPRSNRLLVQADYRTFEWFLNVGRSEQSAFRYSKMAARWSPPQLYIGL